MSRKLRSLLPFILASLGFTLVALATTMPLFDWEISEIVTDLPSEVSINSSWTTRIGDSLASDLYVLNQVMILKNGNRCSPEQLYYVVRRSRIDETVEQIALFVNQVVVGWLTGLTQTGQITMAVFLFLCGAYIWWFTILHGQPIAEAIITTIIAVVLLGILINVWRVLAPNIGTFLCLPELRGTVSLAAKLSKIHYETLIILFAGILAKLGALGIMLRHIIEAVIERKKASN